MLIFRGRRKGKDIEIEEIPASCMMLVPPAPHLCQECAVEHSPGMPHDAHSLYYQTKFQIEHGRAPTWADAIAHCSDEMKAYFVKELRRHGIEVYQA